MQLRMQKYNILYQIKRPLWVDYQLIVYIVEARKVLGHPENLGKLRNRRCLTDMEIIEFPEGTDIVGLKHAIYNDGFDPGDLWCVLSLLKEWNTRMIGDNPANWLHDIVAPAWNHSYHGLAGLPAVQRGQDGPVIRFRADVDGQNRWYRGWKFLRVKRQAVDTASIWSHQTRPDRVTISPDHLIFEDGK